ncbi:MAG: nucleotidyltransferase domain-containing protein [Clostridiales bacterium]|jgi:predicted nucleotidyltransferase|nr:nucleotidyltransferase domain-containing protein [Clostridiales bacterium]
MDRYPVVTEMGQTLKLPFAQSAYDSFMDALKQDAAISAVYLFGSCASGRPTIFSDIDIAIVSGSCARPDRARLRMIEDELKLGIECDFVHTTAEKIRRATRCLDVNYSIKNTGVLLWQR